MPKTFKATLRVKNFKQKKGERDRCWSIGITENKLDGTDEFGKGDRKNYVIGWASKLPWKEYGWAPCNCRAIGINGKTKNSKKYGETVTNGDIELVLDKDRNLIGKIDGESQGIITKIPEGEYYLAFGADKGKGEINIVPVEELI